MDISIWVGLITSGICGVITIILAKMGIRKMWLPAVSFMLTVAFYIIYLKRGQPNNDETYFFLGFLFLLISIALLLGIYSDWRKPPNNSVK